MNTEKLESNLKTLVTNLNQETFIYDLLMAYELPKAAVTRLQKGDYNISKVPGELLWKKKLFFKKETDTDLHHLIDKLRIDPAITKQQPRFIVVTDFQTLLSVDTKTGDTLDISISELAKHYDFFLPWAGLEKVQFQSENPADVKAAERMGRLYDIILEDNPTEEKDQLHALNIFLSRLLFCFFAEDTGIFQDNQFTNALASHNFLIIAYKELCKLEIKLFRQLQQINALNWGHAVSGLHLNQFYGIELDDFAHETAKLSLWLTAHQMNLAFKEVFGETRPTLPLQDGGNIVCGNATRLDWEVVCPKIDIKAKVNYEVYIIGNPPYLGARNQSKEQKSDMSFVFKGHKDYKDSDYVCCWFLKGVDYIYGVKSSLAFVSTNSITQGEQVGYLWPRVLERTEIGFAHQSFKWANNAKGNAGITCIVIGIRNKNNEPKILFSEGSSRVVKNISPYLYEGKDTIAFRTKRPISQVPKMVMGNMARDGGNLILSKEETFSIQNDFPDASNLIKKLYGAYEFLNSGMRWCLWITDENLDAAKKIRPINERIENVYKFRLSSIAKTTQQYASIPHKFAQRSHIPGSSIILPRVSSERRKYIPFGYFDDGSIISDSAQAIYAPSTYIFAIISSRMHMTWVRTVAGRLKTDYRYSSELCYNTFPFPQITEAQKTTLEGHVFKVLDERELHSEKTMAQLYDPDKMPKGLRQAHHEMDLAVEQCYRQQPFKTDEERLEYLFALYEKMIEAEGK